MNKTNYIFDVLFFISMVFLLSSGISEFNQRFIVIISCVYSFLYVIAFFYIIRLSVSDLYERGEIISICALFSEFIMNSYSVCRNVFGYGVLIYISYVLSLFNICYVLSLFLVCKGLLMILVTDRNNRIFSIVKK